MVGKTRARTPLLLLMEDIEIEMEIKTETERDRVTDCKRREIKREEQSL